MGRNGRCYFQLIKKSPDDIAQSLSLKPSFFSDEEINLWEMVKRFVLNIELSDN